MEIENHCTALSCKTNRPKILHYADTHKSDGGSQWKDKITMRDHVGQVLAVALLTGTHAKQTVLCRFSSNKSFWRSFTSSMIVFSAMRLRCEIAHLLRHVSHAGQIDSRFMAEEGTINVLFYTAKRLREGGDSRNGKLPPLLFQSADRMSL